MGVKSEASIEDEIKREVDIPQKQVNFKSEDKFENIQIDQTKEKICPSADDNEPKLIQNIETEDVAHKFVKNGVLETKSQPGENDKSNDAQDITKHLTPKKKFLIIKRCLEDKDVSATDLASSLDLNLDIVRTLMKEVREVVPSRNARFRRQDERKMKFYCEFCHINFSNKELLEDHMKSNSHHETMGQIKRLS